MKNADPGSRASGVAEAEGIEVASSSMSSLELVGWRFAAEVALVVLLVDTVLLDELTVLTIIVEDDVVAVEELVEGVDVEEVVLVLPNVVAAYAPTAIMIIMTTTIPTIAALPIPRFSFDILLRVIERAQ